MRNDTVTASKMADFVFCGQAWRLAKTGHLSTIQPAHEAGTSHHRINARAEAAASKTTMIGYGLITVALLGLFLWALTESE